MLVIDAKEPTFMHYGRTRLDCGPYWDAVTSAYWEALRAGGVSALVVDAAYVTDHYLDHSRGVAFWLERIRDVPFVDLVRSVEELNNPGVDKRIGLILSCHSASAFGDDLTLIGALHSLGVRVMGLTFQHRNLVGDGCAEATDGGLSVFGRRVVRELNRIGMSIDLSHASYQTMRDTLDESRAPVFLSHSNSASMTPHPRNVPDDILIELARQGGVCGISAWSEFLPVEHAHGRASIRSYVDMIRHMVDLIGVEHVAIGSDIVESQTAVEVVAACGTTLIGGADAGGRYATGLRSRASFVDVIDALLESGFSLDDVQKIMGENLLRFFAQTWTGSVN